MHHISNAQFIWIWIVIVFYAEFACDTNSHFDWAHQFQSINKRKRERERWKCIFISIFWFSDSTLDVLHSRNWLLTALIWENDKKEQSTRDRARERESQARCLWMKLDYRSAKLPRITYFPRWHGIVWLCDDNNMESWKWTTAIVAELWKYAAAFDSVVGLASGQSACANHRWMRCNL